MLPAQQDSDTAKSPFIATQVPGLTLFATLGTVVRWGIQVNDKAYFVADNKFYEVSSTGVVVSRGTIGSFAGPVRMDKNRFQAIIVDGVQGYVMDFLNDRFVQITEEAFTLYGSTNVSVCKGTAVFNRPGTDVFYTSEIDDALTINADKFATAEASPDKLVAHIWDHENLFLFGTEGTEVHDNTGGTDFVFTKNGNATIQTGCASPYCVAKADNTIYWVGTGKEGSGIVYRMNGFTPQRVSTEAVEQMLQNPAVDLTQASAFSIQDEGHALYFVNAPGLETTLVFDAKGKRWHEWAEFVDGSFRPFRATCHVFCYGKHLIGASDGKVYYLDHTKNKFGTDVMCRAVVSPHKFGENNEEMNINVLEFECDTGKGLSSGAAGKMMVRYSKDKGNRFSDWRYPNLGVVGDRRARPRIYRLGKSRDWVFEARCTDDVAFNIIGVHAR
jgi:hypothetical protein